MTQRCLTEKTFPPKTVSEDVSHEKMCHAGHTKSSHSGPARGPLAPCYPIIDDQPTVAYPWTRTVPCPNPACPAPRAGSTTSGIYDERGLPRAVHGAKSRVIDGAKSSKGGRCGGEVPLLKTFCIKPQRKEADR